MSILLSESQVEQRRAAAAGPLAGLATSLGDDLRALMSREIHFPRDKALLSRKGGRCEVDQTLLEFDPFNPHEHRCPKCERVYRGGEHDRFWIYWYQLWLAERAVHASVLAALGDVRFVPLAETILDGYAQRYADYPNVDNVLGPTRLFFSTYLESIWLLQICVASDLLAPINPSLVDRVRDQIVVPSRFIISEFDEGASNRQVWNAAALLASARLLGDSAAAERAVFGKSGVVSHLESGLLADGSWYEGENYHLFAHRGLWFGVAMAEAAGMRIPHELLDRFQRGFSTPFATALPDFTLPSRRDSQYAISLRQWRIAEHCEIGFARRADRVLLGALSRMYDGNAPHRSTGRDRSSAEVERNAQPSALARSDLSWRALLFAAPTLPPPIPFDPPSTLLAEQGIAVFRRDGGRVYVALDYGHSGGGHGHPDRLNLLFSIGDTRWLDDFGTGSYTDPSLHWYRSTLAHNAPLFDGRSQERVHGDLIAYDEREDIGWVEASVREVAPEVTATRSVVVANGYIIDRLRWEAPRDVTVDVPIHAELKFPIDVDARTAVMTGGTGREDGFEFVRDSSVVRLSANASLAGFATAHSDRVAVFISTDRLAELWRATAPGAPSSGDHVFRVIRMSGIKGEIRSVWSWDDAVREVEWRHGNVRLTRTNQTVDEHRPTETGWRISRIDSRGQTEIDLAGTGRRPASPSAAATKAAEALAISRDGSLTVRLGERHYRRSEQRWKDADELTAEVVLRREERALIIEITVPRSDRTFVEAGALNPYDNEPADVNGDSVQLYVAVDDRHHAVMLIPEADGPTVRVRPIDGWKSELPLNAAWSPTQDGYRLTISIASDVTPTALDIIVNEKPNGRDRRRGQLVLSGGEGEFVYLRGDRHDIARLIPIRFE